MKLILSILLICLNLNSSIYSQDTIKFIPLSSETASILPKPGDSESPINNRYTSVTDILKEDGRYYMLYNDLVGGWPAEEINIVLATSGDLETWELIEQPILTSKNLPFSFGESTPFIFATSIIKNPVGGYLMYFDVLVKDVNKGIGVAISQKLTGPWNIHEKMIIEPDQHAWDKEAVTSAEVKYHDGMFIMYYSGSPNKEVNSENGIMRAVSKDGISWNRNKMPVFRKNINTGFFDSHKVENVKISIEEDQWTMIYRTDNGDGTWGGNSAYGMAKSWDGINWQRVQDKPVISEDDISNWMTIWSFAFLKEQEYYHIFLEYDGPPVYATRVNHAVYKEAVHEYFPDNE